MSDAPLDDRALVQLARELGLEKLAKTDLDLLRRARDAALNMADRLRRPDDMADEPAHIFQPRADD
ncbi:MAG: hypothetical protein QF578_02715 [Alphaproteobacteria bacterium]|jgi:hypothetical protein|nr:hypothetical protein [Alphaproteobacteria bacterium]MDP6563713.1 hypothetical protein [Alphaproteobacteria bacterium]